MKTPTEAAKLLGVQRHAVIQAIKRGKMKAEPIMSGSKVIVYQIEDAEVERYARENLGKVGRPRQD